VDDIEVEIVDSHVGELLAADGLDLSAFMEGVPKLGNEEELFSLYEAILNGTGDTLSGFHLIAIIWEGGISNVCGYLDRVLNVKVDLSN
jgi:hypothetical protein